MIGERRYLHAKWEIIILIISHFLVYNRKRRRIAMNYLTSMQTAEKWGLTKRRVNS